MTQTQPKRRKRSSQTQRVDNNKDIRNFFKPSTHTLMIAATEEGKARDKQGLSNATSNSKSKDLKTFVTSQQQTKHINTNDKRRVLVQTNQSNSSSL